MMHGVRVWLQGPALMARQRGRRADATDLTDTQGARIALLIREAGPGGRPRKARRRSWSTPSSPFCAPGWQGGFSRTISRPGRRSTTPSGAGSVKACGIASPTPCSWLSASEPGVRRARPLRSSTARPCSRQIKRGSKGFDAGRRIKGRKRPILTDTDGRLLAIQVQGADIQDRDGAKGVLKRSRALFPFVERAFVDGGDAGRLVHWARSQTPIVREVVKRGAAQTGFAVIRRRGVVERAFAWIVKNRHFVRDCEQLTAVAETLITIAATATLIRRWT